MLTRPVPHDDLLGLLVLGECHRNLSKLVADRRRLLGVDQEREIFVHVDTHRIVIYIE